MSPREDQGPQANGVDPVRAMVLMPVAIGLISSVLLSVALRALTDWPEGTIQATVLAASLACAAAQFVSGARSRSRG